MLGALALGLMGALSRRETIPRGDDLIYQRMAQHPFAVHTFPFAFRIGLPWLVHVLPFSYTLSFQLLACLGAGAAAGFAYVLMYRLHTPRGLAGALALALAISPPMLIVALRDGRNTDAITLCFMMAATLWVVERRPRALAITLLVGVLFREAVLFVIPFAYAIWATRAWDKDAAKRTMLLAAPALGAFLALHLAIPSVGRDSVPGYGGSLIGQRVEVIGPAHFSHRAQTPVHGLWTAVVRCAAGSPQQPLCAARARARGLLAGVDDLRAGLGADDAALGSRLLSGRRSHAHAPPTLAYPRADRLRAADPRVRDLHGSQRRAARDHRKSASAVSSSLSPPRAACDGSQPSTSGYALAASVGVHW
jgi:hypothetical protein